MTPCTWREAVPSVPPGVGRHICQQACQRDVECASCPGVGRFHGGTMGTAGFILAPPPLNRLFCIYPRDGNSMGHLGDANGCQRTCTAGKTFDCSFAPTELEAALVANRDAGRCAMRTWRACRMLIYYVLVPTAPACPKPACSSCACPYCLYIRHAHLYMYPCARVASQACHCQRKFHAVAPLCNAHTRGSARAVSAATTRLSSMQSTCVRVYLVPFVQSSTWLVIGLTQRARFARDSLRLSKSRMLRHFHC